MRKIETQLYVVGIQIILEITSIPGMVHLFTKSYDKNEVWLYKAVFSHLKYLSKLMSKGLMLDFIYRNYFFTHVCPVCLFRKYEIKKEVRKIKDMGAFLYYFRGHVSWNTIQPLIRKSLLNASIMNSIVRSTRWCRFWNKRQWEQAHKEKAWVIGHDGERLEENVVENIWYMRGIHLQNYTRRCL